MGKSKWSVTQFQYISKALILVYNQNKLQKRLWEQFRHDIFCMGFQEKCFSCHIPLNGQISQPDCLYSLRYWSICVLQFLLTRLYLRKKRAFKVKEKAFFIILKGLSFAKNSASPQSAPLRLLHIIKSCYQKICEKTCFIN